MIEGIKALPFGSDKRAAYMLMYLAGLRLAETCGLTWSDLKVEPGYLYVLGKGDKTRLIPLAPRLAKELQALLTHRKATEKVCDTDKIIRTSRAALQKWAERNGNFGCHQLRHKFAYEMGRRLGIHEVALLLGHSSISTTVRYAHANAEDIGIKLGWNDESQL